MRKLTVCLLVLLASAVAADRDLAGRHAGEWKSGASGSGGAIQFALEAGADGSWKCVLTFGLSGAEVQTTMREVKVKDSKVDLSYDFDIQGVTARSHATAEWDGTAFRGKYETSLPDGTVLDSGTWNASRVK